MVKWENGIKENEEGIRVEKRENILSSRSLSSFILFPLSFILSYFPVYPFRLFAPSLFFSPNVRARRCQFRTLIGM